MGVDTVKISNTKAIALRSHYIKHRVINGVTPPPWNNSVERRKFYAFLDTTKRNSLMKGHLSNWLRKKLQWM